MKRMAILCLLLVATGCQKKDPRVVKERQPRRELLRQQKADSRGQKKIQGKKAIAKKEVGMPRSLSVKRQLIDKIVARVNGSNVLLSYITQSRIDTGVPFVKRHDVDSGNLTAYKQGLERAISEELLFQKAAEKKVLPTALDIEKQIASLKAVNGITKVSDEEFELELAKEGFTQASYRYQLSRMLAVEKLRQTELSERTLVNTKEIEDYYQAHKEYISEKYTLEIADFNEREVGLNPTKEQLLRVKSIEWERLPALNRSDIAAHLGFVFKMNKGDISEPIKTSSGYQLVQLADKQTSRAKTLEEQYSAVERILREKKRAQFEQEFLKELRNGSTIVYL